MAGPKEDAMTRPEFKRPPEEIDMAVEERAIRRDTSIALVVTLAAFFGAYHYLPGLMEFPEQRAEALAMAALAVTPSAARRIAGASNSAIGLLPYRR